MVHAWGLLREEDDRTFLKVRVKEDRVEGLSFLFMASFSSCFLQIRWPSFVVVIGCMASGLVHFSRVLPLMLQALTKLVWVRGSRSSKAFSCLSYAVIAILALGKHDGALGIVAKNLLWWILSRFRRAVSSYNPQASCFLLFSSPASMSDIASFVLVYEPMLFLFSACVVCVCL
ncbi:hypothetical protein V6N13_032485 [Hibiscus sabdariffa]